MVLYTEAFLLAGIVTCYSLVCIRGEACGVQYGVSLWGIVLGVLSGDVGGDSSRDRCLRNDNKLAIHSYNGPMKMPW
jgi:hypothetical protein